MSCSTYSRCKLSIIQLGGLLLVVSAANSFASLMPVGPMTFSSNVGSFPTVLTIQNMDTASGCVGFMGGSDLSGRAANSGFAFRLDDFEAGLAAEFFANPANRVGGAATITGSAGGAATFSLASMRAVHPSSVPEPGTVLYLGAAGLVMGVSLRIRR